MSTAIAVVCALAAACAFAVAATLQYEAASTAADSESLRPRLLIDLARNRRWLAGVGLAAASYGAQAVALGFGPIVLGAPVAATDLLFALPLIARRRRQRLTRLELVGAACVAGGVAAFLVVSPPTGGIAVPSLRAWVPAFAVVGALLLGILLPGRRRSPIVRTALFAAAAALVFGLVGALSKSFVDLVAARHVGALARWEPYALLVAGCLGMLLAQSAFQSGALAVSLPVIDTLEPVSGAVLGSTIFHEHIAATPGLLVAQLGAAAVAVVGIVVLDTSPLARSRGGSAS